MCYIMHNIYALRPQIFIYLYLYIYVIWIKFSMSIIYCTNFLTGIQCLFKKLNETKIGHFVSNIVNTTLYEIM